MYSHNNTYPYVAKSNTKYIKYCYCPFDTDKNYTYPQNGFIKQNSINLSTALFLAANNAQVSNLFANPSTWVIPNGFEKVIIFTGISGQNTTETFGFIIQSPNEIVLSFRGTKNTQDAIKDLQAIKSIPYTLVANGGKVGDGFFSVYNSTRSQIMSALNNLDPRKQLYISGHSLGASLATLAALDIATNTHFKQPIVYTFASPMTGDSTFANAYNQTIKNNVRVYNTVDVVPKLPPAALGFTHVAGGYPITKNAGSLINNHLIGTAYFPALTALDPTASSQLCASNPPNFCPTATTSV